MFTSFETFVVLHPGCYRYLPSSNTATITLFFYPLFVRCGSFVMLNLRV